MSEGPRPELAGLAIADPPERWRALGFAVDENGELAVGEVRVTLGIAPPGGGITGWSLRGLDRGGDIGGLPTTPAAAGPGPLRAVHPNGALAIDHVVIVTPGFDALAVALDQRGLGLRRVGERDGRRQGFRRLGGPIMEIVEAPDAPAIAFWGVTFTVADLAAVAHVTGPPRDAVQPGRRIAAVGPEAGLSTRVAFMDPGPG